MEGSCFMEDMIHVAEEEQKLFESILAVNFRKAEILRESTILTEADVKKTGWENAKDVKFREAPAENTSDDNKSEETSNNASSNNSESGEADKKVNENIAKKILNIFATIGKKIKAAFEALIEKMKRIFLTDSKIRDKYLKAVSVEGALQGYPGIENFFEPNLDFEIPQDAIEKVLEPYTNIFKAGKLTLAPNISSEVDGIIAGYKNAGKDVPLWNKDGSAHFDFAGAINKLANGKLTKPIFYIAKKIEVKVGNLDQQLRGQLRLDQGAAKDYFKESIELCKKTIEISKKYFGSIRRALISCGTYAIKKTSTNPSDNHTALAVQHNAADMALIADMLCEEYLEEQFAYI